MKKKNRLVIILLLAMTPLVANTSEAKAKDVKLYAEIELQAYSMVHWVVHLERGNKYILEWECNRLADLLVFSDYEKYYSFYAGFKSNEYVTIDYERDISALSSVSHEAEINILGSQGDVTYYIVSENANYIPAGAPTTGQSVKILIEVFLPGVNEWVIIGSIGGLAILTATIVLTRNYTKKKDFVETKKKRSLIKTK
ncbi:MAG: hypothetical protein KAU62_04300 [Candidatus Heimdallarchaeota archaeon]|nr:hypothetical protein [Candidatus Heimdallarchaeota archaeon]MCG3255286.1 hypothetical protein [Candidatus Heimdallarchaeota archaeon]MCK4610359.1 hypothetical protein [Candidatus Heimdallarchaeota archaeon]